MSQQRPFESRGLNEALTAKLDRFLACNDFTQLYRSYSWKSDTYGAGFPGISSLELRLRGKTDQITLANVKAVKCWGCPRGTSREKIHGTRIIYPELFLDLRTRLSDLSLIGDDPGGPAGVLAASVSGVEATYASKVLRFVMPEQYGAIDTRQVSVFGVDGRDDDTRGWLPLRVMEGLHGRSVDSDNKNSWHTGYGVWINILRYFAGKLPDNCPHPNSFTERGLRCNGIWAAADVEMALFAFASRD